MKKEKISAATKDAALTRIHGTTDYARLKDCDLVIEAATENEALKLEILRKRRRGRQAGGAARVQHVVDLDHPARGGHRRAPRSSWACTSSTRCR